MKMTTTLILWALGITLLTNDALSESPKKWTSKSNHTRTLMLEMDLAIRDRLPKRSYDRYMKFFSADIQAYGLYEDGPADLDGLRKHYHPVFFELRDGVLLSDEVIVAGPMAAQRYHSMLYLDGEFDGVEARGIPVHLRGQTFFLFNTEGKISKRWSNHDHAFRMKQLLGDKGAKEGSKVSAILNGPGMSESEVLKKLRVMTDAFNLVTSPDERLSQYLSFFREDVLVHGLAQTAGDRRQLSDYLEKIWNAFPDLTRVDEAKLTAWSFGAVRWRALGSHRGDFDDHAASMQPALLKGEAIMKFDITGKISEIWINDDAVVFE